MRVIEILAPFAVLPTVFYLGRFRVHALPVLWMLMGYCLWALWRDGELRLAGMVPFGLAGRLPSILAPFLVFAVVVAGLVGRYSRGELFGLVRKHPGLWTAVMVAYPALSVYPQGVIFRAFFFERYRALFPDLWLMVLMSALAFAYMHIVFRNWIAMALTGLGGLLFAARYAETGSLFVSCFEHALYGCWLFTVGLGRWFFYRAQWKSQANR